MSDDPILRLHEMTFPDPDPYFSNLPRLHEWSAYPITDDYVMYIYGSREENQFLFVVVNQCDSEHVMIYCWGRAFFDGVRHFYLGSKQSDNEGYIFYFDPDIMVHTMATLKKVLAEYGCNRV
jgi:hypothetical protein